MNKLYVVLAMLLSSSIFAQNHVPHIENPPLVPIDYRQAGFWIGRHPAPDSLIMDSSRIARFNARAIQKGLCFSQHPDSLAILADRLKPVIQSNFQYAKEKGRFDADGKAVSPTLWTGIEARLNLKAYGSLSPRFAFPIRFTNQRLVPHAEALSSTAGNIELDYLQNSGADIGEPTIIYHESADGKWLFGANHASAGWYLKQDMVILDYADWLAFKESTDFVVTTSDKSDLYLDDSGTRYHGFIRMGNRLPLIEQSGNFFKVALPSVSPAFAYISKADANPGYLPYTARNVYQQAFKLQNAPYGWGDLNAEYDCSGLLKQLFQCFGIYLPRNGAEQAAASSLAHSFKQQDQREQLIKTKGIAAASLLRFPGHIMLYLGSIEGRAYALHALYGYSQPSAQGDRIVKVNKTVVSDLSLGEGSARKSLLQRLSGIYLVSIP